MRVNFWDSVKWKMMLDTDAKKKNSSNFCSTKSFLKLLHTRRKIGIHLIILLLTYSPLFSLLFLLSNNVQHANAISIKSGKVLAPVQFLPKSGQFINGLLKLNSPSQASSSTLSAYRRKGKVDASLSPTDNTTSSSTLSPSSLPSTSSLSPTNSTVSIVPVSSTTTTALPVPNVNNGTTVNNKSDLPNTTTPSSNSNNIENITISTPPTTLASSSAEKEKTVEHKKIPDNVLARRTLGQRRIRDQARFLVGSLGRQDCLSKVICGLGARPLSTRQDVLNDYMYLMNELISEEEQKSMEKAKLAQKPETSQKSGQSKKTKKKKNPLLDLLKDDESEEEDTHPIWPRTEDEEDYNPAPGEIADEELFSDDFDPEIIKAMEMEEKNKGNFRDPYRGGGMHSPPYYSQPYSSPYGPAYGQPSPLARYRRSPRNKPKNIIIPIFPPTPSTDRRSGRQRQNRHKGPLNFRNPSSTIDLNEFLSKRRLQLQNERNFKKRLSLAANTGRTLGLRNRFQCSNLFNNCPLSDKQIDSLVIGLRKIIESEGDISSLVQPPTTTLQPVPAQTPQSAPTPTTGGATTLGGKPGSKVEIVLHLNQNGMPYQQNSGTASAAFPGTASGPYPGTAPGPYAGMMPGAYPGMAPGTYPGMVPGTYPGMAPGTYPGMSSFPSQISPPPSNAGLPFGSAYAPYPYPGQEMATMTTTTKPAAEDKLLDFLQGVIDMTTPSPEQDAEIVDWLVPMGHQPTDLMNIKRKKKPESPSMTTSLNDYLETMLKVRDREKFAESVYDKNPDLDPDQIFDDKVNKEKDVEGLNDEIGAMKDYLNSMKETLQGLYQMTNGTLPSDDVDEEENQGKVKEKEEDEKDENVEDDEKDENVEDDKSSEESKESASESKESEEEKEEDIFDIITKSKTKTKKKKIKEVEDLEGDEFDKDIKLMLALKKQKKNKKKEGKPTTEKYNEVDQEEADEVSEETEKEVIPTQKPKPKRKSTEPPPKRRPVNHSPPKKRPEEERPPNRRPEENPPPKRRPEEERPPKRRPEEQSPPKRRPEEERPPKRRPEEDRPPKRRPEEDRPPKRKPEEDRPPKRRPEEDRPPKRKPEEDRPPKWRPQEERPPKRRPEEERPPKRRPEEDRPPKRRPEEERPPKRRPEEDRPPKRRPDEQSVDEISNKKPQVHEDEEKVVPVGQLDDYNEEDDEDNDGSNEDDSDEEDDADEEDDEEEENREIRREIKKKKAVATIKSPEKAKNTTEPSPPLPKSDAQRVTVVITPSGSKKGHKDASPDDEMNSEEKEKLATLSKVLLPTAPPPPPLSPRKPIQNLNDKPIVPVPKPVHREFEKVASLAKGTKVVNISEFHENSPKHPSFHKSTKKRPNYKNPPPKKKKNQSTSDYNSRPLESHPPPSLAPISDESFRSGEYTPHHSDDNFGGGKVISSEEESSEEEFEMLPTSREDIESEESEEEPDSQEQSQTLIAVPYLREDIDASSNPDENPPPPPEVVSGTAATGGNSFLGNLFNQMGIKEVASSGSSEASYPQVVEPSADYDRIVPYAVSFEDVKSSSHSSSNSVEDISPTSDTTSDNRNSSAPLLIHVGDEDEKVEELPPKGFRATLNIDSVKNGALRNDGWDDEVQADPIWSKLTQSTRDDESQADKKGRRKRKKKKKKRKRKRKKKPQGSAVISQMHWQTANPSLFIESEGIGPTLKKIKKYVTSFTGNLMYLPPNEIKKNRPPPASHQKRPKPRRRPRPPPPPADDMPVPIWDGDDDSSSEEKCRKGKGKKKKKSRRGRSKKKKKGSREDSCETEYADEDQEEDEEIGFEEQMLQEDEEEEEEDDDDKPEARTREDLESEEEENRDVGTPGPWKPEFTRPEAQKSTTVMTTTSRPSTLETTRTTVVKVRSTIAPRPSKYRVTKQPKPSTPSSSTSNVTPSPHPTSEGWVVSEGEKTTTPTPVRDDIRRPIKIKLFTTTKTTEIPTETTPRRRQVTTLKPPMSKPPKRRLQYKNPTSGRQKTGRRPGYSVAKGPMVGTMYASLLSTTLKPPLSKEDDEQEPPHVHFQPMPGGLHIRKRPPPGMEKFHETSAEMLGEGETEHGIFFKDEEESGRSGERWGRRPPLDIDQREPYRYNMRYQEQLQGHHSKYHGHWNVDDNSEISLPTSVLLPGGVRGYNAKKEDDEEEDVSKGQDKIGRSAIPSSSRTKGSKKSKDSGKTNGHHQQQQNKYIEGPSRVLHTPPPGLPQTTGWAAIKNFNIRNFLSRYGNNLLDKTMAAYNNGR